MNDALALSRALTDGTGLPGMVSVLRRVAKSPAAFVDLRGSVLASAPHRTQWPLRELRSWQPGTEEVGSPPCTVRPVSLQGELVALLTVQGTTADDTVLQLAVELASLEFARLQALLTGRRELAGQVLEDVFAGRFRGDEARERLASIGVTLSAEKRYVAIVGRTTAPTAKVRTRPANLHSLLAGGGDPYARATLDDDVVLVVPDSDSIDAVSAILLQHLQELDRDASVGIGHAATDPLTLTLSYHQAREAARQGGVNRARSFNLGNLLLGSADTLPVRELALRELAPLIDHDRETGGELLHTLAVYLDCDGSVSDASRRLYLHRNTLRYRLNLIARLTGWSPDTFTGRMHFWIAIRSLAAGGDSLIIHDDEGDANGR